MEHLGICYSPLSDIKVLKVTIRCLVFEILVFWIHDVVYTVQLRWFFKDPPKPVGKDF